jgi:signal transduction histidine kinase
MTRRILLGFLGVLIVVIVAVVVPLGFVISSQQTNDFRAATQDANRAVAAVAEEHLDDNAPLTGLRTVVQRFVAGGDRIAVLDADGRVIAQGGRPIPGAVLSAALAGRSLPNVHDALVATRPIGDAGPHLGVAVLVRDAAPLDHRHTVLWTTLILAGGVTIVIGAVVGWSLGRWITRPLSSLVHAAHGVGLGDTTSRADADSGPPQVREVGASFNEMADRVATLLDAQRAMTAEVSHQLRTPLASLRLRLELLAGELGPQHADDVTAIVGETNRLARLVDGLLAVARAEDSQPTPERTDLVALAEARVEAWRPVAAERGIAIDLQVQKSTALVTPGHAEQILDNLLDNAVEATPSGGRILVGTHTTERGTWLSVADNGPGMSAERRAHAFDRFVTSRGGEGGSGLGLAIVNRLVNADRGRIEMSETVGGGLTVTVTLPRA